MNIPKRALRIGGSIILGITIFVLVVLKYPFKAVFSTFSHITPGLVLVYMLVSFSIMMLFVIRWRFVLKSFGHHLSFSEAFSFRVIEYGISYMTPSGKAGGEPVRAALLTRKGIKFKDGLAAVVADKSIELSVSVLFFIFGLMTLALDYALPAGLNLAIILFSLFLLSLLWIFHSRIMKGKHVFAALYSFLRLHRVKFLGKYQQAVIDFEKPIIKFYKEEKKSFYIALSISVMSLLLSIVEYKLILLMLGINASISIVFIVFSVVGIAFLVPVPMGLGSLEALEASVFSILNLGSASGVGLAMITRARDLLWVMVGVIMSLYIGSFKNVMKEAYDSRYSNPFMKAVIFRDGRAETINIKMFRHPAVEKKYLSLKDLKERNLLFNKKKGKP
jgi:uncharacterized protein (TIRG00374 family)